MTSLERCAEALLEQKAVQSSSYEHLEGQISIMERTKRSHIVDLKLLIADVERRQKRLAEVQANNLSFENLLEKESLHTQALLLMLAQYKKKHAFLAQRMAELRAMWEGQPSELLELLQAVQQRDKLKKEAAALTTVLQHATPVFKQIRHVISTRAALQAELRLHTAQIEAGTSWLQQRLAAVMSTSEEALAELQELHAAKAAALEAYLATAQQQLLVEWEAGQKVICLACLQDGLELYRTASLFVLEELDRQEQKLATEEQDYESAATALATVRNQADAIRRQLGANRREGETEAAALRVKLAELRKETARAEEARDVDQTYVAVESASAWADWRELQAVALLLQLLQSFQTAASESCRAWRAECMDAVQQRHTVRLRRAHHADAVRAVVAEETLTRRDLQLGEAAALAELRRLELVLPSPHSTRQRPAADSRQKRSRGPVAGSFPLPLSLRSSGAHSVRSEVRNKEGAKAEERQDSEEKGPGKGRGRGGGRGAGRGKGKGKLPRAPAGEAPRASLLSPFSFFPRSPSPSVFSSPSSPPPRPPRGFQASSAALQSQRGRGITTAAVASRAEAGALSATLSALRRKRPPGQPPVLLPRPQRRQDPQPSLNAFSTGVEDIFGDIFS